MKKDNRGFSLVELIIVMAIMAVLAGGTLIGIGMVSGKAADECANKLFQTIQSNRMTAMGKYSASLSVYKDTDGVIWVMETVDGVDKTPIQIGSSGVSVQYRVTGDGDSAWRNLGDDASPLILSFDRSNGSFKDLESMGLADKYCLEIRCSKANKVKVIKLYHLTGKIAIE